MTYHWFKDKVDQEEWVKKNTGRLLISNEYFFNNANIILNHDKELNDILINSLTGDIEIKSITRTKDGVKYKGIDVDKLNVALREKLNVSNYFLFEVYNDEGIFYTSKRKKGFDFAHIDSHYNVINLWNMCFGRRALHNGEAHWRNTLKTNSFIKEIVTQEGYGPNSFIQGQNQVVRKNLLTTLGELQFGNWGLAYRDLFKLLHADTNSGVDLFIYVTADNKLLDYASDGIVSYDKTIGILNEFSSLIKVPIWVIGLDLDIL